MLFLCGFVGAGRHSFTGGANVDKYPPFRLTPEMHVDILNMYYVIKERTANLRNCKDTFLFSLSGHIVHVAPWNLSI